MPCALTELTTVSWKRKIKPRERSCWLIEGTYSTSVYKSQELVLYVFTKKRGNIFIICCLYIVRYNIMHGIILYCHFFLFTHLQKAFYPGQGCGGSEAHPGNTDLEAGMLNGAAYYSTWINIILLPVHSVYQHTRTACWIACQRYLAVVVKMIRATYWPKLPPETIRCLIGPAKAKHLISLTTAQGAQMYQERDWSTTWSHAGLNFLFSQSRKNVGRTCAQLAFVSKLSARSHWCLRGEKGINSISHRSSCGLKENQGRFSWIVIHGTEMYILSNK